MTCESGTFETTSLMISLNILHLGYVALPRIHLRSNGHVARLRSRRQISLMCSWTPKISCTTSTVGNLSLSQASRGSRNLAVGDGIFTSPADASVSVVIVAAAIG